MADDRSAEELAGGFLKVSVNGSTRNLPTLKIRAEREWKLLHAQTIGEAQVNLDWDELRKGGDATYAALAPMANLATDISLELLVAYDATGALGGREWLEENADSSELYRALLKVLKVVFPFVHDLRTLVAEFQGLRGLLAGPPAPSTNSSSMNGLQPVGESLPRS